MSDHDQTGRMSQGSAGMDDATMGSPKGGGLTPAEDSGLGRYGGADADDTSPGSGHDPLSGPGATAGGDSGSQDAMTTHGGSTMGDNSEVH